MLAVSMLAGVLLFTAVPVYAQTCPDGTPAPAGDTANCVTDFEGDCTESNINEDNCGIVRYIVVIINILSALVGVAVVASIIIGGIQYSTAGSDPQKVQAAKARIRNAIIALLFFIFGYAILNFLVPGGLFYGT